LARDLGEVRDRDVQIGLLYQVLAGNQEPRSLPGIVGLLAHLEWRRDRLQPRVIRALERLRDSRVLDRMASRVKRISRELAERGATVASEVVVVRAGQQILSRLAEVRSREGSLADPENAALHHVLRIAVKRLRYAMEIPQAAFDGRLNSMLDAIKHVQGLLGQIHDCDVWAVELDAYLRHAQRRLVRHYGHAGPLERIQPGIEYLRGNRRRERRQSFQQLVDYWRGLSERGFWEELAAAVTGHPRGRASGREAPAEAVATGEESTAPSLSAPGPESVGPSNGQEAADHAPDLPRRPSRRRNRAREGQG
jgi:CHAD domain-containing protein